MLQKLQLDLKYIVTSFYLFFFYTVGYMQTLTHTIQPYFLYPKHGSKEVYKSRTLKGAGLRPFYGPTFPQRKDHADASTRP